MGCGRPPTHLTSHCAAGLARRPLDACTRDRALSLPCLVVRMAMDQEAASGLFRVDVQKKRPKDAAVAIEYQGYWYYIQSTDKRTKATLSLIQALFNLQLSEPKKGGPLLTLPVGV
jgi:hypothetical protein